MELEWFLQNMIHQTQGYSELEKIRYVYITLGKIMSFDINFSYGNEKTRRVIYTNCHGDEKSLNSYFESQVGICKSIAYLFAYILKKMNICVETVIDSDEEVLYQHVSNVVILKNGIHLFVDLQHDLENIQTNMKTKYFGKDEIEEEQLKEIDKKIGYIAENSDYTENYFYLLQKALNNKIPFQEKIAFILSNVNVYTNITKMGYVERKNYYYHFILKFITEKEKNKIHFIDCYQMKNGPKEYQLCIVVESANHNCVIYIYSNELHKFIEYSLEEVSNFVKEGLVFLESIPSLKKYMNKQKTIQKELH